jgi:uncharacterized membrane protein YhaH (DUF805 family)
MFRILFGEIKNGKLKRLAYLGWYFALALMVLLTALGIGAGIGVAERIVGGNLAEAQSLLAERFGVVGLIGIIGVFAVLGFAFANIAAKRVRDMGLPGWWVIAAAFVIGTLASSIGEQISGIWTLATTLALLLIPSNAFGGAFKSHRRDT